MFVSICCQVLPFNLKILIISFKKSLKITKWKSEAVNWRTDITKEKGQTMFNKTLHITQVMNSGTLEGSRVPAPLVVPVVLLRLTPILQCFSDNIMTDLYWWRRPEYSEKTTYPSYINYNNYYLLFISHLFSSAFPIFL